jgi:hypothetical protein
VRPLTDAERQAVTAGLRSPDAVVLRRCQIMLASARGERAPRIAEQLGCDDQTVLDARQACNAGGLPARHPGSARPHRPPPRAFRDDRAEQLRALLPRSPREFGHRARLWTLDLAAAVSGAEGWTPRLVRAEAVRKPVLRRGIGWASAGHRREARQAGDHQPRSGGRTKKRRRDRLIALTHAHATGALGCADAVGGRRVWQPHRHAWAQAEQPVRLGEQPIEQPIEQPVATADAEPKALSCYGVLVRRRAHDEAVWLRFVVGRPVRVITLQLLDWCGPKLAALGVPVWALLGANACWHVSKALRAGIPLHHRSVKQPGHGIPILVCYRPLKRPCLNPLEPQGVPSKRAIVEPTRLLSAQEVAERLCA